LIIALCPSYDTIGVAAPVLLVAARLLQGLSVGGEYGTSATYLSEIASARHRGFYSRFQYVTLIAGQLLALGLLVVLQRFVLSAEELERWGWRIPFLIGAMGALPRWRCDHGCRKPRNSSEHVERSAREAPWPNWRNIREPC
jgi:MHS family alpha-ketoglutarate permease-like MFS transporter